MEVLSNKPKLSPLQNYLVARALIDPIRAFYELPENIEKFQRWLESKKKGVKDGEAEKARAAQQDL